MKLTKLLGAAAAISMATAPVMAAPVNPAASLSVSQPVRAGAPATKASELHGGFIIPLIALVAIIAGIIAATSGSSHPKSP